VHGHVEGAGQVGAGAVISGVPVYQAWGATAGWISGWPFQRSMKRRQSISPSS
jgi:hypothetical protein